MIKEAGFRNFAGREISHVSILVGAVEVDLNKDQIGLFEISDIRKQIQKGVNYGAEYNFADYAIIEIHKSCIGEIEFLYDEKKTVEAIRICYQNGEVLKLAVYKACKKYHANRITSKGDLRIVLGRTEEEFGIYYEASPSAYFNCKVDEDGHREFDYTDGEYYEKGNLLFDHNWLMYGTRVDGKYYIGQGLTFEASRFVSAIKSKLNIKRLSAEKLIAVVTLADVMVQTITDINLHLAEYTHSDLESGLQNIRIKTLMDEYNSEDNYVLVYERYKFIIDEVCKYARMKSVDAILAMATTEQCSKLFVEEIAEDVE